MSTFDFSGLVEAFATNGGDSGNAVLRVARHAGMEFVDGIGQSLGWTLGTVDIAAVFPLTPRELEALPEGEGEAGAIKLFVRSPEPLFGVRWGRTDEDGRRGDVVEWESACWQIVEVKPWAAAGRFYECVAVRVDKAVATLEDYVVVDGGSAALGAAAGLALTDGDGGAA